MKELASNSPENNSQLKQKEIQLPLATWTALDKVAVELKTSTNQLIELAIDKWLQKNTAGDGTSLDETPKSPRPLKTKGKVKVLIIEDDRDLIDLYQTVMETDRAMDVITAADGETAAQLLIKESIDIVVCDVRIPGYNGTRLLKNFSNKVPFIMASGHLESEQDCKDHGAIHFLKKPLQMRALVATIRDYFRDELEPPVI